MMQPCWHLWTQSHPLLLCLLVLLPLLLLLLPLLVLLLLCPRQQLLL
jgi:hypothetical protein